MRQFKRGRSGFSLIEALLVVALFVIIMAAASPRLFHSYHRFRLDAAARDLVHTLRFAQNESMAGRRDDVYSLRLQSGLGGGFILYKGRDFGTRDPSFDEVHALPAAFDLSHNLAGPDIIFMKIEGSTVATGAITLAWPAGRQSRVISLNSAGRVDYE